MQEVCWEGCYGDGRQGLGDCLKIDYFLDSGCIKLQYSATSPFRHIFNTFILFLFFYLNVLRKNPQIIAP